MIGMKDKCYRIAITLILIVVFFSCTSGDEKIVRNLYKEREYLVKMFKDKSVLSRGKVFYQLSYYKGQSVNTFSFQKKDDVWGLIDDSLQYPINEIAAFSTVNTADRPGYVKTVRDEFNRLLNIMGELKVDAVSAENAPLGIDMKIYFGDYKALLYIEDINMVKNEEWKKYIRSGGKLDDNWYYVKDEL
jgi:hypothetical protein